MKKLLITIGSCALLGISASAFAVSNGVTDNSGFFVGGSLGLARANFGALDSDAKQDVQTWPSYSYLQGGVSAGAYAGWHFNQYFDAQLGYLYLPSNKYSASDGLGDSENATFKTQAIDVLGKAYLPLSQISPSLTSNFSVYAQGGMAYVMSRTSENVNLNIINVTGSSSLKRNAIEPAYGLGAAYAFNPHVVVDVNWLQIYGPKNSSVGPGVSLRSPLINTVNLGLTYRFVND